MGQSYSNVNRAPQQYVDESGNVVKRVDVRISYVSKERGTVGHFMNIDLRLEDLANIQTLVELAQRLKSEAMHEEVFLMVDIGNDFTPSDWLRRANDQSAYKGIFAGLFLTGLEIRGAYSQFDTPEHKLDWWNNTQQFLTELNLGFRAIAEIKCPTMVGERVLDHQSHADMSGDLVNLNRVVFQIV